MFVRKLGKFSMTVMAVAALSACGTTPPEDFGGRWRPVNRFADSPTEIPLYSSYIFQVVPTDGTLKRMLERWAKDNRMALDYRLPSDYTLFDGVTGINTTNAKEAASALTTAYSSKGVSVELVSGAFVVSRAERVAPAGSGS
jgi:hypothetical protein